MITLFCPWKIYSYHLKRFELHSPNKIKKPAQILPILPHSEQKQTKNRLTELSDDLFLQNAPKEIHFELYDITIGLM